MPHVLPPLPYDYNALEPHIDEQTMRLHHDIHHKAYVDGLNAAEEKLAAARASGDFAAVQALERAVAFHGSGHFNHCIFWENMSPNGGGTPSGDLAAQIDKDFGSFEAFKGHFSAAAATVEGNGWGVPGWHPVAGRLMIDVWEHAYYLNYQNKRPAYVEAWWNVVNWANVSERFEQARSLQMQNA